MLASALLAPMRHGELTGFSTMTRNYATFQSAFPDDSAESDSGDLIPRGNSLAKAIASRIASAKVPYQHSFYGWKFEFKTMSGRDAWVLIQQPGPWLLIVETKCGWLDGANKRAKANEEAVDLIKSAIEALPEVSKIAWLALPVT